MPMSGSNYVAPTWVDKGPPALDAAELQAMCNTIVQNQGDAEALQAALQALTTTVNGKARISTGSYVGTGSGAAILSGLEDVQILFIMKNDGISVIAPCWVKNESLTGYVFNASRRSTYPSSGYYGATVTNNGSTVTLDCMALNINASGVTYNYLAFSV